MSTLLLFVGMAVASGIAVYLRGLVHREALSYTNRHIAIVGIAFGLVLAGALQVIAYYVASSWTAAATLFLWGLIATGYLFHDPHPDDRHQNVRQVALAAAGCYVVLTLAAIAFRIFA